MISEELIDITDRIFQKATEEDCEVLIGAIKDRMNYLRSKKALALMGKLQKGDRVRVKGVKPKYLEGLIAVVTANTGTKAMIRFEDPTKARRFGRGDIKVPLSMLEPL